MAERKSNGDSKKAADEAKPKPDEAKGKPKPDEAKETPKSKLNVEERMEGVQGWMAELEKRQERSTRVGGIAVGVAVLASAGALALGILNKQDAASSDDVDALTEKVNALGASVAQQTEKQLNGINQRLGTIEQQIASITERQRKAEADIATLKTKQAAVAADAADAVAAAEAAPDAGAENQP